MSLAEYKRKRNFQKTSEPKGKEKKGGRKNPQYVIQKHAASRLHYDFRLELDGTLKSWAVPKGPSYNPADKRLAVHVEDHPIEYGAFEGTIPKGQYGGGTVMVWDRGTWESIDPNPSRAYKSGKMKFELHGEKLKGAWALVRIRSRKEDDNADNWLLIKEHDEYADESKSIIEDEPISAATGRTLAQIAEADGEALPKSAAAEQTATPKRSSKAVKPVKAARASKTVEAPKAQKHAQRERPLNVASVPLAQKKTMPTEVTPQLCTLVDSVPEGNDWIHEVKFDGYRIVAFVRGGKIELMSRNGKPWTHRFPLIASACGELGHDCILDGEVVALRPDGTSDFQMLQNFLSQEARPTLAYFVFDLLYVDGYDLTKCSLRDRKKVLGTLLDGKLKYSPLRISDFIEGNGKKVYDNSCRLGLEGVISKMADAAYIEKRSRTWVKVKCIKSQEFVIAGYTAPGGSRTDFGALLLGYYEKNGDLRYAGRVGTGFTEKTLKSMGERLRSHEQAKPAFIDPPTRADAKGVTWLKPTLVCEVEFTEWTHAGQLRHPSFKGLREDKKAKEVVRERPRATEEATVEAEKAVAKQPAGKHRPTRSRNTPSANVGGVEITHPDKLMYPEGITKQRIAEYYEEVADRMLPYIAGRPLSFLRCPDGRDGACFFQKHITTGMPDHVKPVKVREKEGTDTYCMVEDKIGLLQLVNFGILEFHIWGSRAKAIERPDVIAFDLDPAPDVPKSDLVRAAKLLKSHLEELGLKSFLKTTGGKGLHVLVPLAGKNTWDDAKAFTQAIATHMAEEEPDKFTANMSKAKRSGRIYVDFLRNSRGQTFIAPYSTRARENAPVSVPIEWKELAPDIDPAAVTATNFDFSRGAKVWKEFASLKQTLPAASKSRLRP